MARPGPLDRRLHPAVQRLADARRARAEDPRGVQVLPRPDGVARRRGDPRRGLPAAEFRHLGRPLRRPDDDLGAPRPLRRAGLSRLLRPHLFSIPRLRPVVRPGRDALHRRDRVELGVVPRRGQGDGPGRLRRGERRGLGHEAARRARPVGAHARPDGRLSRRLDSGRLAHPAGDLRRDAPPDGAGRPPARPHARPDPGQGPVARRPDEAAPRHPRLAVQPLLRDRLRRLRRALGLAADLLQGHLRRHPPHGRGC